MSRDKVFAVLALSAALVDAARAGTPPAPGDAGAPVDDAEARRDKARRILESMPPPERTDLRVDDSGALTPLYEQRRAEATATTF